MNRSLSGLVVAIIGGVMFGCASPEKMQQGAKAREDIEHAVPDDSDGVLRRMMLSRWSSPERRTWRIEYRAIVGAEGSHLWHVDGTQFWVRLVGFYSLEKLNKDSKYDLDAVALDQSYGVIDFYVYRYPREVIGDKELGGELKNEPQTSRVE